MRRLFFLISGVLCALSSLLSAHSTTNNLWPNAEVSFTPQLGDSAALNIKGEVGPRIHRGDVTLGFRVGDCQRLKFSGEYLGEKLRYEFTQGNVKRWVNQYSVGAEYQQLFNIPVLQSLELGGIYAHAYKKNLHDKTVTLNNNPFLLERRIAGSDAALSFLGLSLEPWRCAYLSGTANYDYVRYHRHYESGKTVKGFGGTVGLIQWLGKGFSLALDAEFRKPFDFYKAAINWKQNFREHAANFGLYASYTQGKKDLPNVIAGGARIDIDFLVKPVCCRKDTTKHCYNNQYCDLTNWVAQSAAFVPVVLAIPDQRLSPIVVAPTCTPPTSTAIPNQLILTVGSALNLDFTNFFTGEDLTWSATGLPAGVSINPTTGIITGTNPNDSPVMYTITITATNSCGSTSQTFDAEFAISS